MISERLGAADFLLGSGRAAATTRKLFTHLNSVRVDGLSDQDQVVLQVMDFGREDISLFLPLWAGIPQAERARRMVQEVLFTPERFGRQYGIPASAAPSRLGEDPEVDAVRQAVRLPWNQLVGEGLLAYGLRQEAARLIGNNMSAIIRNLKTQRAFSSALHAANGAPLGERNSAPGLPPLGLFLQVLGVRIESPERVALSGKNPFPWPVTVQYRGLRVTRELECTRIVFPDGRAAMIDDPADVTVTAEPEAA